MTLPSQQEWEAAVLRLFEDEFAFISTGPRTCDEWCTDVVSIMARRAVDPRGWKALDWEREAGAVDPENDSTFPFVIPPEPQFREIFCEITASAAAKLLVALTDEWFKVKSIPGFVEREDQLLADARTILARYGSDFSCYTTAANARVSSDPDFFSGVTGGAGITNYLTELGLVVVSDAEVGVFWRFNGY